MHISYKPHSSWSIIIWYVILPRKFSHIKYSGPWQTPSRSVVRGLFFKVFIPSAGFSVKCVHFWKENRIQHECLSVNLYRGYGFLRTYSHIYLNHISWPKLYHLPIRRSVWCPQVPHSLQPHYTPFNMKNHLNEEHHFWSKKNKRSIGYYLWATFGI